MPVSPKELQFQAQKTVESIQQTAPERARDVGVVVLFFNRHGDQAVGFATNAVTDEEKRATVSIMREFCNHLTPSRIIVPH